MSDKKYQEEDWLREKYLDEQMSSRQIANVAGCSHRTILNWLDKFNIETREAKQDQIYAGYNQHSGGYMRWQTQVGVENTKKGVLVHRLLAVAEYGYDEVVSKVVHHKNGIKWDNRPDNIELMDNFEHSCLHNPSDSEVSV